MSTTAAPGPRPGRQCRRRPRRRRSPAHPARPPRRFSPAPPHPAAPRPAGARPSRTRRPAPAGSKGGAGRKTAAFPVVKTLDELDRSACSIPGPTLDYLASLEWITARENLCLAGPAGTGKSHVLVALGIAAVHAGHKVRYFTAADLTESLYRGLADNSVGKVIENLDHASTAQNTRSPPSSPQSITRYSPGDHTPGRRPR